MSRDNYTILAMKRIEDGLLPAGFGNLWHIREDQFSVRIASKLWTAILLRNLDRPIVNGRIIQLQGRRVGPGVYEITVKDSQK